jgi:hypothetical protein
MTANSKGSRSQSRLEKAAREDSNIGLHYEVQAKTTREKIARLRALRLAKEAADKEAGEKAPKTPERPLRQARSRPSQRLHYRSSWRITTTHAARRGMWTRLVDPVCHTVCT